MARSQKKGAFLARGYFNILSPMGEVLFEKEPFTLIVESPRSALAEVLSWAKGRAVVRSRIPQTRVKLVGMKILPRKNHNPRQLSLF